MITPSDTAVLSRNLEGQRFVGANLHAVEQGARGLATDASEIAKGFGLQGLADRLLQLGTASSDPKGDTGIHLVKAAALEVGKAPNIMRTNAHHTLAKPAAATKLTSVPKKGPGLTNDH